MTRASSTRREHDAPAGVRGPIVATASAASLFAMGGFAIYGARVGVSVMVGGLIAVANLAFLAGLVRSLTTPRDDDDDDASHGRDARDDEAREPEAGGPEADEARERDADAADKDAATRDERRARDRSAGRRGGLAWGLLAVVKIVVLFGGMWLLLTRGWVDPIALLVGYGALPLGISAGTLGRALRP